MMTEDQLNQHFHIKKYSKPYENFYERTGFNDNVIEINTKYWWTEDLVADKLKEIKIFEDFSIYKTRELHAKEDGAFEEYIFKGSLSPIDLWVPGKAFIEVRYTSDCNRDGWGYDFQLKNISRIRNWIRDPGKPSRHKHKIYLAVFHWKYISLIDLSEKPDDWYNDVKNYTINVREENCIKRIELTNKDFKKYKGQ